MSMDNGWHTCPGCDELVDDNNSALGVHMDEDRQYWHSTCWSVYESEQCDKEPDYDYVRYEDTQHYRQSMMDAGRGHLLP